MIYGKPYTSEFLSTKRKVQPHEGYVKIFGNKERPTPEHICSPTGTWMLPKVTNEIIRQQREKRYKEETDEMKRHIETDLNLNPNDPTLELRLNDWRNAVMKIKSDLPFIERANGDKEVNSYYNALVEPTSVAEPI